MNCLIKMSFKLFASPHRNISRHISNIGTMSFRCTSIKLASLSSGPEPADFIVRPDEDALPSAPPSGAYPVVLSLCSICPYRRLLLPRPLGRGKEGSTRGLPATHAGGLTQASERGCTAYTRTQGTARPVCRRRLGTRPGCQQSLPSQMRLLVASLRAVLETGTWQKRTEEGALALDRGTNDTSIIVLSLLGWLQLPRRAMLRMMALRPSYP